MEWNTLLYVFFFSLISNTNWTWRMITRDRDELIFFCSYKILQNYSVTDKVYFLNVNQVVTYDRESVAHFISYNTLQVLFRIYLFFRMEITIRTTIVRSSIISPRLFVVQRIIWFRYRATLSTLLALSFFLSKGNEADTTVQLSSASIPLREPRCYVSLSQSLLDVVAQAGNELRSVLYEISPAFNLSRGYVVISVQDTAWKPENSNVPWIRDISRLAGHGRLQKSRCHFRYVCKCYAGMGSSVIPGGYLYRRIRDVQVSFRGFWNALHSFHRGWFQILRTSNCTLPTSSSMFVRLESFTSSIPTQNSLFTVNCHHC